MSNKKLEEVTTRPERPLGLLEKYQLSKQLTGAYGNITLTTQLEHATVCNDLQQSETFYRDHFRPALARLVTSHPNLTIIVKNKMDSTVHFEQLATIDLSHIVEITTAPQEQQSGLAELIRAETDKEFDLDSELPLWRIKIVPKDSTHCIVVSTFHHMIADGMSLSIFWKEFLEELNKMEETNSAISTEVEKSSANSSNVIQVNETKVPLPYEGQNPPNISILWDVVPVVMQSLVPKVVPKPIARFIDPVGTSGWRGDFPAVEGENHNTKVCLIHISQDLWKPILKRAKQEKNISGHAVLFTNMMIAWATIYQQDQVITTEATTPINCRGLCNPPVPTNQIGNFVGSYTSVWTGKQLLSTETNAWELAKKYHDDLQKNKVDAAKQALFLKFLPEFPASYCDYWYDKRKNSGGAFGRTGGIEVSDLGKFDKHNDSNTMWKVQQMYFCQSAQIFTNALSLNSVSLEGELYCTLSWQKGSLDEDRVNTYHDVFISTLKQHFS